MALHGNAFTCQRDGLVIRGYEFLPGDVAGRAENLPVLIMSHGFKSSHREMDPYGRYFAGKGYACYTYDFCGGGPKGKSDGKTTDMSVRTEMEDLQAVLSHVESLDYTDNARIYLMGCSQGGFVSALTAAALPEQIAGLLLFYPAFSIPDDARAGRLMNTSYDPENLPETIKCGAMTIGRIYPEEAQRIHEFAEAAGYTGPVLILHGTADPVVNVAYSRALWLTYQTGAAPGAGAGTEGGSPQASCADGGMKSAHTSPAKDNQGGIVPQECGTAEQLSVPPSLPEGCTPRPDCQLLLIGGAGHGFLMNRANHRKSLFAAEEFLKGYTEVLTIDVRLTDSVMERHGLRTHLELPFGGTGKSPYFEGEIGPGARDVQEILWIKALSKCADYTLAGRDYTGTACSVHIVNRDDGNGWKPTVTTDSAALSFLNGADCDALLENRKCGPIVRIYTRVPLIGTSL